MAKLDFNVASAIELAVMNLPSFGDTFVENTNEGVKISIQGADEVVHEAFSGYFAYDDMDVIPKKDHILIVKKIITEGLTNDKINDIYSYIITKKDAKLIDDFNKLILPFLGDSVDKIEVAVDKIEVVAGGLDTVLKANGVNHDDFVVNECNTSESIADVMPNVKIGDVIEITTEQDVKDNFGKYADQLGNVNDLSMWLNNGGYVEIEITDTLADTVNGIDVDVRLSDGSSKLPNDEAIKGNIQKYFTDEDIKKHIGSKKLFENFGFEAIGEEFWKENSELNDITLSTDYDADSMVAKADSGVLIYSPGRKMVKVYPTDDVPYIVEPVVNENDANRVLIAVNDSDNDSSALIDSLNDMKMKMIMEEAGNEDGFTKDEFTAIIDLHNVSGTDITKDDITDDMIVNFNIEFKQLLKKYPDFDIFSNDYEGQQDEDFKEILISILKLGNLSLM